MSTLELIANEIKHLPEPMKLEVYDFARFLRTRSSEDAFNGLLLSESVLNKDWETPEEDEAWSNL
jgi:hypothetical protein